MFVKKNHRKTMRERIPLRMQHPFRGGIDRRGATNGNLAPLLLLQRYVGNTAFQSLLEESEPGALSSHQDRSTAASGKADDLGGGSTSETATAVPEAETTESRFPDGTEARPTKTAAQTSNQGAEVQQAEGKTRKRQTEWVSYLVPIDAKVLDANNIGFELTLRLFEETFPRYHGFKPSRQDLERVYSLTKWPVMTSEKAIRKEVAYLLRVKKKKKLKKMYIQYRTPYYAVRHAIKWYDHIRHIRARRWARGQKSLTPTGGTALKMLDLAKADKYSEIEQALNEVGWIDRDDVAWKLLEDVDPALLMKMTQDEAGSRLLARLFDELTEGSKGYDERSQARRILKAKMELIGLSGFEQAARRTIKIFPYETPGWTRFWTPLNAERRPGGKIWVQTSRSYARVSSRVLEDQDTEKTVRQAVGRGIVLSENEIIGVKRYDLGGIIEYQPALYLIQLANEQDQGAVAKGAEAFMLGLTLGSGALVSGAGRSAWVVWGDRILFGMDIVASIIEENQGWIIKRWGPSGRRFVRVFGYVRVAIGLYGISQVAGSGKLIDRLENAHGKWRADRQLKNLGMSPEEIEAIRKIDQHLDDILLNAAKIRKMQQGKTGGTADAKSAAAPAGKTAPTPSDVSSSVSGTPARGRVAQRPLRPSKPPPAPQPRRRAPEGTPPDTAKQRVRPRSFDEDEPTNVYQRGSHKRKTPQESRPGSGTEPGGGGQPIQWKEDPLPDGSVFQIPKSGLSRADYIRKNKKAYLNMLKEDPRREAGIYHNPVSGDFILVQGDEKSVFVATKGSPSPLSGGKFQKWKQILDEGEDVGRWELVRHYHPPAPGSEYVSELNRLPSGAAKDMDVIYRESVRAGGKARTSTIDYMTPEGPNYTTFGFNPDREKPYWVIYPDPKKPGERIHKSFAELEEFHEWVRKTFNFDPGPVPKGQIPGKTLPRTTRRSSQPLRVSSHKKPGETGTRPRPKELESPEAPKAKPEPQASPPGTGLKPRADTEDTLEIERPGAKSPKAEKPKVAEALRDIKFGSFEEGYIPYGIFREWGLGPNAYPAEGWKIHISAVPESSPQIADIAMPMLRSMNVDHKVVNSPQALADMGLTNTVQAGKFITIWPKDAAQARSVANALDNQLAGKGLKGKHIVGEKPVGSSGLLYARYGGLRKPSVTDPSGKQAPDVRGRYKPDWIKEDPFPANSPVPMKPPTIIAAAAHPLAMTAEDVTDLAQRLLKKPVRPMTGEVHLYGSWDEYADTYRRIDPGGDPPGSGYFNPATGHIHISPRGNMLTILHEAVHKAAEEIFPLGRKLLGRYLNEGITENIVRRALGPRARRHGYDQNVRFVRILERRVGQSTVENAVLHGAYRQLRDAIRKALGGSEAKTLEFFTLMRRLVNRPGGRVNDPEALRRLTQLLAEMGR